MSSRSRWVCVYTLSAVHVILTEDKSDFSTMEHKLDNNQYPNMDAFIADAQLVFDNCKTYNPEETVYVKNARKMEKFVKQWLNDRVKKEGGT